MAFIARISPLWAEYDGRRVTVMTGVPGAQIVRAAPLSPSAIAFVMLMIASVSFDGLHETFRWVAAIGLKSARLSRPFGSPRGQYGPG